MDFSFVNITGSSVGVQIPEPEQDNAIKIYKAFVKDGAPEQACVIKIGDDPLLCTISGLSAAHAYTVGVKACARGSNGCGAALEKSFRTV